MSLINALGAQLARDAAAIQQVETTRPEGTEGASGTSGVDGANEADRVSFSDALADAIDDVNDTQLNADAKTKSFIAGEDIAIHDVMAAVTKAELTVQMTSAVAAKAIQAYQDIMRIQV